MAQLEGRPQELDWSQPYTIHSRQVNDVVLWIPFLPALVQGAFDLVGGYRGSFNGGTAWTVDREFLAVATLDGTDDDISLGDVLDFDLDEPFSIVVWSKRRVATNGVRQLVSKCATGSTARGYLFDWENDEIHLWLISDYTSGNYLRVRTSATYTGTDWMLAAVTYDGSETAGGVKLYRDGLSVGTSTVTDNLANTTVNSGQFRIGGRDAGVQFFDGQMGEVRVYNRAKTADEIWEMFNPRTRWELYGTARRRASAAVVVGTSAVGKSVRADWDILSAIAKSVRLDWDLWAAAGRSVEVDWELLAAIGRAVRLDWNILSDEVSRGVLWRVERRGVTWEVGVRRSVWELNGDQRGALVEIGGR